MKNSPVVGGQENIGHKKKKKNETQIKSWVINHQSPPMCSAVTRLPQTKVAICYICRQP
jgi:hypothetical protein